MTAVAQVGSVIGSVGLAILYLAPRRGARLAGLVAWAVGLAAMAVALAPTVGIPRIAAVLVGGAFLVAAGAWLLLRWPYLLAVATLVCLPVRIYVKLGSDNVRLLLPLYGVIAALALVIGWQIAVRRDDRSRELGPLALPLACFLVWSGLSLSWSVGSRNGAIFMAAFILPFGLLAVGFARLPWRTGVWRWLWAALVGTGLVYGLVGLYQWEAREVFWNPGLIVGNTYAPFFRVNSVFWDPSIYGRYLTLGILTTLVLLLSGAVRGWRLVGLYAVVAALWFGLLLSFSQSSFVALAVGIVVAAAVVWGWRAVAGIAALVVVLVGVAASVPAIRTKVEHRSRSGINSITSGRANLVRTGVRIAVANPVAGVGVGGFKRAYADRTGLRGADPKRAASHTTPVTVAAEEGLVGLVLLVWLLAAGFVTTLGRVGAGLTGRVSFAVGLAFVAIAVHSLFYNALFEDPTTWTLIGFAGLLAVARRDEPGFLAPAVPGGGEQGRQHEADQRIDKVGDLEDPA